jgi:hypothetical protein
MSKVQAASLLLIEAAKSSFYKNNDHRLHESEWISVCNDLEVQKMVLRSTGQSSGFMGLLSGKEGPTKEDFVELCNELKPKLAHLEKSKPIRAFFLELEVEKLLYPGDPGVLSEGLEDIIFEFLAELLNDWGI